MLRISTWVAQAQEVDSGEDWSAALQQDAHVDAPQQYSSSNQDSSSIYDNEISGWSWTQSFLCWCQTEKQYDHYIIRIQNRGTKPVHVKVWPLEAGIGSKDKGSSEFDLAPNGMDEMSDDFQGTVNWHWIITEIKEKQEEKPQQAQVQLPYNLHYFDPAWGDITVAVTRDYVSEREVVGERDLKYIAYFARNRGNIEVSQPYLDKGYWRVQVSTKNGANAFSSISRRFGTEPQNTFGSFFKDKVQAQQFYAAVMAAAAGS